MPDPTLAHLSGTVLLLTGLVGLVLGITMRRSRFCTMGALADRYTMGDATRLRVWVAAMAVAILGTQALAWAGLIRLEAALYTAPRLLPASHLVGGFLFGVGMVLASGCPTRGLLRAAGGNLKAWVVLIVTGLVAYMSLRGILAALRAATVDRVVLELGSTQDLPALLTAATGMAAGPARLGLGAAVGIVLLAWAMRAPALRRPAPLLTALIVGGAIVAMWFISGHLGYVAEHPETLTEAYLTTQSDRMEALSFIAPLAHTLDWLLFWTDTRTTLTLGMVAVLGVFSGALIDALLTRTFTWEGFHGADDTGQHMLGAALMGCGGVTALGCSIGQGLSGISTLAVGSILALAGILAGGIAGLKWQMWRIARS